MSGDQAVLADPRASDETKTAYSTKSNLQFMWQLFKWEFLIMLKIAVKFTKSLLYALNC